MVPWDNGWVQGTGGNDTIGPGYVEPVGSGSDVIDGGDGITSEFPVMRHMANLESVRTYEGTDEVHQLVIGRELTGIAAF